MALDELLLRRVSAGGRPALRFYGWDPPCLSLGRNQPAAGRVDLDAAARHGVDIVRRPTGGLAVLHHLELTYAVAVPVGLLGSPRETYAALCRALASGLRRLGAPAMVVGDAADAPTRPASPPSARGAGPAPPPSARGAGVAPPPLAPGYLAPAHLDARCFASAAPGEIAASG
ncbi:MAG TPA: hypothetical protein VMK65_04135, partial [Longimicrobiales bacterium]|nr:hypothetical protein [Longimicrobiales bacterium]